MKYKALIIGGGILAMMLAFAAVGQTSQFFRLDGDNTIYKAYSTAAEFFKDGGAKDFSNVRVIDQSFGSVASGGEYQSVTMLATTSSVYLFKSGWGTFGSVVINVLGTGNVVFYDAITSNVGLRALATSSLPVVGVIAASQAAGTYTYDTNFHFGLLGVFNGAQGTSTLTLK